MEFVSGIVLFLLGIVLSQHFMKVMGTKTAGKVFNFISASPLRALAGGFVLSLVLQSSSAATVVIMSLAGAEMISLSEAYPMVLGAGIGTAVVVQIISFRLFDIAPLLALVGLILWISWKKGAISYTAALLMCLGLVFMGMEFMEKGMPDTASIVHVVNILQKKIPGAFLFFLIGFLITSIFQASAFTIGLFMVLAVQNALELHSAFAGVLGANAGTGITGLIAAFGVKGEGRRVAIMNFAVKLLVALLVVLFLFFINFGFIPGEDPARKIANFHLFYNVGIAAVLLPLRKMVVSAMDRLWKPAPVFKEEFTLQFLSEELVKTPSLAIQQAKKEVSRLISKVIEMSEYLIPAFEGDTMAITRLREHDDLVDFIEKRVRLILTRISREELSPREADLKTSLILIANHVENIADVMARNLGYLAEKKMRKTLDFSPEGWKEIKILFEDVKALLLMLKETLDNPHFTGAEGLKRSVYEFKEKINEFHLAHLDRLQAGLKESIVTSSVHIDVLGNAERIADYIMDCVYLMEGAAQ